MTRSEAGRAIDDGHSGGTVGERGRQRPLIMRRALSSEISWLAGSTEPGRPRTYGTAREQIPLGRRHGNVIYNEALSKRLSLHMLDGRSETCGGQTEVSSVHRYQRQARHPAAGVRPNPAANWGQRHSCAGRGQFSDSSVQGVWPWAVRRSRR